MAKKYCLTGLITETISMEVEAENLQEAIDMCCANYNFSDFDEDSAIEIDGEILEVNGSQFNLCDIEVADRVKY